MTIEEIEYLQIKVKELLKAKKMALDSEENAILLSADDLTEYDVLLLESLKKDCKKELTTQAEEERMKEETDVIISYFKAKNYNNINKLDNKRHKLISYEMFVNLIRKLWKFDKFHLIFIDYELYDSNLKRIIDNRPREIFNSVNHFIIKFSNIAKIDDLIQIESIYFDYEMKSINANIKVMKTK